MRVARQNHVSTVVLHFGGDSNPGLLVPNSGFWSRTERFDWPRDAKLYPYVKRHGGRIAETAGAMGSANCLVHGEILGGRKNTRKSRESSPIEYPDHLRGAIFFACWD